MRKYYRVMLGQGHSFAQDCLNGGFIGTDFGVHQDLSKDLGGDWREFNMKFIPVLMKLFPQKNKISAGLGCGALYTVSKGIEIGDLVLCPDGQSNFLVGEVTSGYQYVPGEILFHRRNGSARQSENRVCQSL